MTEKEFRKLVFDLELNQTFKDKVNQEISNLEITLKSELSKHLELISLTRVGSLARLTFLNTEKNIDLLLVLNPFQDKGFALINQLTINEIMNIIAYNYPSITKLSDIEYNPVLNMLQVNLNDLVYKIFVRYENIANDLIPTISDLNKHVLFTELANRDYTYFRNTVNIIKYYRDEQKINISGHLIEVLLYYGLNEYFFGNRYETYLSAFMRSIDDLLKPKKISVTNDILIKLEVEPLTDVTYKGYVIIDPANQYVNLVQNYNDLKLGEFRKLKKVLSKLVDNLGNDLTKEQVVLDINPKVINNEYIWSYKIENSRFSTDGGSYQMTPENNVTAMLKALSKGLKTIVDNNLNKKQIKLVCNDTTLLTRADLLSAENNTRRKTIIAYMEVNNITISKN